MNSKLYSCILNRRNRKYWGDFLQGEGRTIAPHPCPPRKHSVIHWTRTAWGAEERALQLQDAGLCRCRCRRINLWNNVSSCFKTIVTLFITVLTVVFTAVFYKVYQCVTHSAYLLPSTTYSARGEGRTIAPHPCPPRIPSVIIVIIIHHQHM